MAFEDKKVCLYTYEGGFNPIPAPPMPSPDATREEIEARKKEYELALIKQYPNLSKDNKEKYIPIHKRHEFIVDKNGRYHPSIDWTSEKCLNQKEKNEINAIIIGEKRDLLPNEPSKCFLPRHGIIILDSDGKIIESFAVCFECGNAKYSRTKNYSELDISVMEKFFKKMGFETKNTNNF